MTVIFSDKKLKKVLNNDRALVRKFGKLRALKIKTRLDQLRSANNLEALRSQPGNFHELIGNRKGQWACDLDQPYRLVFISIDQPIPVDLVGEYEGIKNTVVKVLEVINYH